MSRPAVEPLEPVDAETSAWIERHLRRQIDDPHAELAQVVGKKLKHQYKRLLASMQPGDRLCDWEWQGKIGVRGAYSIGWCVVRDDKVLYSVRHSTS